MPCLRQISATLSSRFVASFRMPILPASRRIRTPNLIPDSAHGEMIHRSASVRQVATQLGVDESTLRYRQLCLGSAAPERTMTKLGRMHVILAQEIPG